MVEFQIPFFLFFFTKVVEFQVPLEVVEFRIPNSTQHKTRPKLLDSKDPTQFLIEGDRMLRQWDFESGLWKKGLMDLQASDLTCVLMGILKRNVVSVQWLRAVLTWSFVEIEKRDSCWAIETGERIASD
jgi:hypothetical protein